MNKNLLSAFVAAFLLIAIQQQANAQFLKGLGKVLQTVGESVLNGQTTNTTNTNTNTNTAAANNQSAPNPQINVKVANCWRMGRHVCIQLTLNNMDSQDKEVEIYNEHEITTSVYDATGAKYGMGLVVDNSFRDLSVTSFVSVKCPSGVPVKVIVVAQNVPQETKSIAMLKFFMARFVTKICDIPIKETNRATNREGLTCNMPYIQCNYQSCVRSDGDWVVTLQLTPDRDLGLQWKKDDVGIYDEEGNTYGWQVHLPALLKDTPSALKLTIKNVPATVTRLHTVLLPFTVGFYRIPFSYEIRLSGVTLDDPSESVGALSTTSPSAKKFVLADGKLGPIAIGMKTSSFPKQVEGLYDKFEKKQKVYEYDGGPVTTDYYLFSKAGKPVFTADTDFGEVVNFVLLEGATDIMTPNGIYVGYSARELFTKNLSWEYDSGNKEVYALDGKYAYYVKASGLVQGKGVPKKAADFKPDAKVYKIY